MTVLLSQYHGTKSALNAAASNGRKVKIWRTSHTGLAVDMLWITCKEARDFATELVRAADKAEADIEKAQS